MNEPSRDGLPRQERGQEQLADEELLADYLDYLHM